MHTWKTTLIICWVAQFFSIMGFSFAIPFAPFYLQDLGVTDPSNLRLWSGLFASAAGLSMAIVTPFWGYLADRVGKKPMTLRASLGGTITLMGMGLAQSPETLLVFRIIQGLFTGTVTAYLTLVVSETPKERMGFAVGMMNSAVFMGNSISPLLGGLFADLFGFRASFFVASGLLLASFLLSMFFVREDFTPKASVKFSFFADLRKILLHAGVFPIVGMIFLYGMSRTLDRPVLPLLVQEMVSTQSDGHLGLATQAGLVTSAAGFAVVLAGLMIGTLADRGRSLKIGVICAFCAIGLSFCMVFVSRVWQLTVLYFGSAFFIGGIDPILKVILARIVPAEQRGSAFGLIGSARSLGWFAGAFSGGILAVLLGLRSVFVMIAGLFAIIAALLALLGRGKDY